MGSPFVAFNKANILTALNNLKIKKALALRRCFLLLISINVSPNYSFFIAAVFLAVGYIVFVGRKVEFFKGSSINDFSLFFIPVLEEFIGI